MKVSMTALAATLLTAGAALAQDAAPPSMDPPPAGEYRLDPAHGSVIVHANHMGFSSYPVRFTRFDVRLDFDPEEPEAMSVTAEIDPASGLSVVKRCTATIRDPSSSR